MRDFQMPRLDRTLTNARYAFKPAAAPCEHALLDPTGERCAACELLRAEVERAIAERVASRYPGSSCA